MVVFSNVFYGLIEFNLIKKQLDKKNRPADSSDLSFMGNLDVKQNIKGRLRIYSDFFKTESQVNNLVIQLSKIDSIKNISYNIKTGSLLIIYDDNILDSNMLINALVRLTGFENDLNSNTSIINKEIKLAHQSINYAIFNKSKGLLDINTILPIIFITLAIREYLKTYKLGIPQPIILLYWAYDLLGLGKQANA